MTSVARVALTLTLAIVAGLASAQLFDTSNASAHQLEEQKLASEALRINMELQGVKPKRLIPGCVPEPLSTHPEGETWTGVVDDVFMSLTTKMKITVWRHACDDKSQILVTLAPTAGTTTIHGNFGVKQNDRWFNVIAVSGVAGAQIPSTLSAPVTALLDYAGPEDQSFDDSAALQVVYMPLMASNVEISVPAASNSTTPDPTFVIDGRIRGAWTFVEATGHGIVFDISKLAGSQIGVYGGWYTSSPAASTPDRHEWFNLGGENVVGDTAVVDIYRTTGQRFLTNAPLVTEKVGTATVVFESCTKATLTYSLTRWNKTGTNTLQRITSSPDGC